MQEATFEAQLNGELRRLFPSFSPTQITHQETFTLRFGTQKIRVGGKESHRATGRLVLLKIDNKPFAVLELKKPGRPLIQDDIDQGISYARLLTPIPPLVVVSNGTDALFFNSIEKTPYEISSFDEEVIKSLFEKALLCAAKDNAFCRTLFLPETNFLYRLDRSLLQVTF